MIASSTGWQVEWFVLLKLTFISTIVQLRILKVESGGLFVAVFKQNIPPPSFPLSLHLPLSYKFSNSLAGPEIFSRTQLPLAP